MFAHPWPSDQQLLVALSRDSLQGPAAPGSIAGHPWSLLSCDRGGEAEIQR